MSTRVTVCELPDDPDDFDRDWGALVHHVQAEASDIVVLNEAPFDPWFARSPAFSQDVWDDAVARHASRISTLDLPAAVVGTAPVTLGGQRHNRAFVWDPRDGHSPWGLKSYLPDEEDVYEASWYEPAAEEPTIRDVAGVRTGVLICTEIWRFQWADDLGREGVQLIATPRATGDDSHEKWFAAGRVAAISAGAFGASSNRVGDGFGGGGWVFSPDGNLLARTSHEEPFVTVELDLTQADDAKATYPRYALWGDHGSAGGPATDVSDRR